MKRWTMAYRRFLKGADVKVVLIEDTISDGPFWCPSRNPSEECHSYCVERPDHDPPHRCCGGSTGDVHEWWD